MMYERLKVFYPKSLHFFDQISIFREDHYSCTLLKNQNYSNFGKQKIKVENTDSKTEATH